MSSFFQLSGPKKGQIVNGSKVINNMIVFTHNGRTYVRNNDTSYHTTADGTGSPSIGDPLEIGEHDLSDNVFATGMQSFEKSTSEQPQSKAAYMADQMV